LEANWGNVFLPGTISAADRFARAAYFVSAVPTTIDKNYITAVPEQKFEYQAVASVMGIMRAVGVPLGIASPDKPNISSSIWRTVCDQKNLIYYFDSATTPNTFWVDLKDVDFKNGASVKKLAVAGGKYYAGNAASQFAAAEPLLLVLRNSKVSAWIFRKTVESKYSSLMGLHKSHPRVAFYLICRATLA